MDRQKSSRRVNNVSTKPPDQGQPPPLSPNPSPAQDAVPPKPVPAPSNEPPKPVPTPSNEPPKPVPTPSTVPPKPGPPKSVPPSNAVPQKPALKRPPPRIKKRDSQDSVHSFQSPFVKLPGRESLYNVGSDTFEQTVGNFPHLTNKDQKYFYEHITQVPDPFHNVDVATDCEAYFVGQNARLHYKNTEHFAYIVDLDNYEYHKVVFHSFLNEILQSSFFRHGILFLVMINAVLIGLATLPYLQPWEAFFALVDMIILSVFIFEIIIKWIYDFRLFWTVNWNMLDFSIVFLTMLASVVPLSSSSDTATIAVSVVRAFRSLRCVSSMTSLSIVTHTVLKSGLDMGNILLVLIIFMLVLSVMAVILFDLDDLYPQRFLNALDAWTVLFICVTQDGWAQILNSYDRYSPYFVMLALYLIFAVSVGAFVFANLIVAVIVANLEWSVKELREEMKHNDNPLEFTGHHLTQDVDIVPVYDFLAKNNFVCISQRPLKIPRLKKVNTRRILVYISLVVALEQNMLEAEIISLDMEKIMAVILSIIVQLDVQTGEIAKEEREAALAALTALTSRMEAHKTMKEKHSSAHVKFGRTEQKSF